jgi:putative transposase
MGRHERIVYQGAHYHVTARGNRRGDVFLNDADRRLFLGLLGETCRHHRWRCFSYCLMANHYHLVICTDEPTLSRGMHRLNGFYARAFNNIHETTGHVFGARYFPKVIEDDEYLARAIRYVEHNPVAAKLCSTPECWPWSSYSAVLGHRHHRPWFDRIGVLALFHPDPQIALRHYSISLA